MPITRAPLLKITQNLAQLGVSSHTELFYDPHADGFAGVLVDAGQVRYFVTRAGEPAPEEISLNADLRLLPVNVVGSRDRIPIDEFIRLLPTMGDDGMELRMKYGPVNEPDGIKPAIEAFEKSHEQLLFFCQHLPVALSASLRKHQAIGNTK